MSKGSAGGRFDCWCLRVFFSAICLLFVLLPHAAVISVQCDVFHFVMVFMQLCSSTVRITLVFMLDS